jgi:drug/metabolite transporter (DMT)-like permease
MNTSKLAALLLIVAGVLGLAYGGFSYTKSSHQADLGPVRLSLDEKQYVSVPVWAGIAAIVAGALLLGFRGRN